MSLWAERRSLELAKDTFSRKGSLVASTVIEETYPAIGPQVQARARTGTPSLVNLGIETQRCIQALLMGARVRPLRKRHAVWPW